MSEAKYKKAAGIINKAGGTPLPINETLLTILKYIINEDELDFINLAFRRKISQTMEQLKESSKLPEDEILKKAEALAKKGVMFNQPNRQGVMVYRLLPLINVGVFEYTFMKKLVFSEENKKLSNLFAKLLDGLGDLVQNNYDMLISMMQKQRPIDRTVPILKNKETGKDIEIIVDESIEVPEQKVVPTQNVEELINKFDDIAVGHCFCRHHNDLLGDPCKQTDARENCFTFGKSARHVSENGFGRLVSKEEALKILKDAEEAGLIHKAYHPGFDITRDETSICNCCKCCCGQSGHRFPTINATNYISQFNQDLCVGCGTCIEKCHFDSIQLNEDNKAERVGEYCIGCGLCAHFCPENAISMIEGERIIRIPPPRRI
ncbi:MAG: ATP-binding protein [Candidatus Hodarchaeota archaeon]